MNEKEKLLLERFVELVKNAIPVLQGIVLYGSLARGAQDRRSDIDVLVIVDDEKPTQYYQPISRIVTDLSIAMKPRRELKPIVTNLQDYDASFYRNVFDEGIILFGKMLVSPEKLALMPYVLVTYDVSRLSSSIKVRISRKVHGYTGKKVVGGKKYEYRYKGLKDIYNVMVISPSTLVVPTKKAKEFVAELEKLRVAHKCFNIYM
ncbi:MAG: nucleotidyltransferase domain-containing protein [Candidatus Thermoplasmatota archaeon]